jgi:selenocysteine lyase/cysteine desulfurase
MTDKGQQEDKFLEFRRSFPAYSQGIYVNHAAVSPASEYVRDRMMQFWKRRANFPVDIYPDLQEEHREFKGKIARLINAEGPDTIACVENTSAGLNMVASGIEWKAGDRILLNTMEFPANVYPFLNLERKGVEVDFITPVDGRLPLEIIAAAVQPRTRMISISFVQFLNGFRADLPALGQFCRARDILLVVDAIQGVGVIPMDVRAWGIDALATGGHKWLMWPMGTGFLYVAPHLLEKIIPAQPGWLSVKDSWNLFDYRLDFLETAEKFEGGTLNWLGLYVAREMLEHFLMLGVEHIWRRIFLLTDRFIRGLKTLPVQLVTPQDPDCRSGIVSFRVREPEKLMDVLTAHRILASLREGRIRFSFHCTNNEDDIQRILEVLRSREGGVML